MGKKRHREKDSYKNETMNNPFGIDPDKMMNMFGNMDIGNFNNIIESMKKEGIDLGSIGNINNNFDDNNNNFNNNFDDNNNFSNNNFDPMQMINNMNLNNNGGMGNLNPMAIINQLTRMNNNNRSNGNTNNNNRSNDNISNNNNRSNGNTNNSDNNNTTNNNLNRRNRKAAYNKNIANEIDEDANIDMLLALKRIVDSERGKFIDRVIEFYKKGKFDEKNI